MKTLVRAALILIAIHLLAVVCFVGWLAASGRVNQDRLKEVVEMFKPTVEEQAEQDEQARLEQEQQDERDREAARRLAIARGASTLSQQLEEDIASNAFADEQLARMRQEANQLREHMAAMQDQVEQQQASLELERSNFEEDIEARRDAFENEDFQNVVRRMQTLDAAQIKHVFENLIDQGQMPLVIEYLNAMSNTKTAEVFAEYQGDEDIQVLTQLLEGLRLRRNASQAALVDAQDGGAI